MVPAILFSSNGLVLSIHSCLFNSSKEIALFSESDCCKITDDCHNEIPGKEKKVNSTCCNSELTYLKTGSLFLNKKVLVITLFNQFEQSVSFLFHPNYPEYYIDNGFSNKPIPFTIRKTPMLI